MLKNFATPFGALGALLVLSYVDSGPTLQTLYSHSLFIPRDTSEPLNPREPVSMAEVQVQGSEGDALDLRFFVFC